MAHQIICLVLKHLSEALVMLGCDGEPSHVRVDVDRRRQATASLLVVASCLESAFPWVKNIFDIYQTLSDFQLLFRLNARCRVCRRNLDLREQPVGWWYFHCLELPISSSNF